MKHKTTTVNITLIIIVIAMVTANKYAYSACDSSSSLNSPNLACSACPTNTIANNYQTIATSCQCAAGFRPSTNGVCSSASASTCGPSTFDFYPIHSLDGDTASGAVTCTPCAGNAFTNMYNRSHKEMRLHAPLAGKEWPIIQPLHAANAQDRR